MTFLAIDTCLAACSAAVVRGGEVLSWRSEPMTRGHQERLAPMVRDLMSDAGVAFGVLDRVAVTVGPGSFTGLRVGLAFAKGLALALDRPCVGVGTLPALADSLDEHGPVAAVIDAGRGRVYLQVFDGPAPRGHADIYATEVAAAILKDTFPTGGYVLLGPGVDLLAPSANGARVILLPSPDPRAVARVARRSPTSAAPRPLYLRPPDAKAKAA